MFTVEFTLLPIYVFNPLRIPRWAPLLRVVLYSSLLLPFFPRIYWTCFSAKTYQMLKDGYQSYSLLTSSLIIYSLTNSVPGSKKQCIFHFHCSSIQNLTMNPPKDPNYADIIQYPSF